MRAARGSIYFRKGQFVVQIDRGRDLGTGKRLRSYESADPCKRHGRPEESCRGCRKVAETLRTRLLTELDENRRVDPSEITVEQYLDRWLEEHAAQVRSSTLAGYRTVATRYVSPRIGALALQRLDTPTLNELYVTLEGHGYGHTTLQKTQAVLRRALRDAVAWGYRRDNPATEARIPRRRDGSLTDVDESEHHVGALTRPQLQSLLEGMEGRREWALLFLAAATGMRRSELVGLKWDCVDLDGLEIRVRRTLHRVQREWVWGQPKTAKSRRTLRLTEGQAAQLRAHRSRQSQERLAAGPAWTDDEDWGGLVFTDEAGVPLIPSHYSALFTKVAKERELPLVGFHGLRHTYATLLIEAGVPVEHVSKQLGHSTTAFTNDVYGHLTERMGDDAATAIDKAMGV